MSNKLIHTVLLGVIIIITYGCKKEETPAPIPEPLVAVRFDNLAADTSQPRTNRYTFFSLKTGQIVPQSDSATTKWDIAFRSTTIIINGGTSGPGQGAAQIVTGLFSDVTTAPEGGYIPDNAPSIYAIPLGSNNGWYSYNAATNVISPIPGRVIVVKTAEGKYAKVEILSYYLNAPATPAGTDKARLYTFRYVYQPDGSKKLN
jgi:hypothetical protein